MQSDTNRKLREFINKPITIFTESIGRNYTDEQYNDYFTGICISIGSDFIETVHPITYCKNIFFIKNIIGICEEQRLDASNPEHQKIINEMNKQKIEKDLQLSDSANIDIDLLNQLIKKES